MFCAARPIAQSRSARQLRRPCARAAAAHLSSETSDGAFSDLRQQIPSNSFIDVIAINQAATPGNLTTQRSMPECDFFRRHPIADQKSGYQKVHRVVVLCAHAHGALPSLIASPSRRSSSLRPCCAAISSFSATRRTARSRPPIRAARGP
jgi:hypothetical protein